MPQESTQPSLPIADSARLFARFTESPLTSEQLDRLRWCANGNTLRFESSTIVDVLVARGYAKQGFGRVVTLTPQGRQYLRTHAR
jgi:hypothetical protein